jgi:dCMP deaminase
MNWKEYFSQLAHTVSLKSKDPSTKVGCVIVDKDNRVVSQGYNGFVAGSDESKLSWARPIKYNIVIHAEANALLFARQDLKGTKAYVSHAPCDNCLKLMLQAGIREIYYKDIAIMHRADQIQKDAIKMLVESTGAKIQNVETGKEYLEDLNG